MTKTNISTLKELREQRKLTSLRLKSADENGILKKGIFRNSGLITKYGLSFLATTLAKNYVSKNSGSILDWVGSMFHKKGNNHSSNGRAYDASTAHSDRDIY